MPMIGSGIHRYDFQREWAQLPRWWNFGEPGHAGPPQTSVKGAIAANGDVYVLCRAAHPVMIFDPDGGFVTSWGEGQFSRFVHGMTIDRDGRMWIADAGLHTITQHEPDGTLLRTLGAQNAAAPTFYGKPFNMPTGTAFTADGDLFVSDGYGNRRVHCFSSNGELKHSWGEPGDRAGPVRTGALHQRRRKGPVACLRPGEPPDPDLYRDRRSLTDWTGFHMPSDLAFGRKQSMWWARTGCRSGRRTDKSWRSLVPTNHTRQFQCSWHMADADENIYLAQFDRAVSKLTRC